MEEDLARLDTDYDYALAPGLSHIKNDYIPPRDKTVNNTVPDLDDIRAAVLLNTESIKVLIGALRMMNENLKHVRLGVELINQKLNVAGSADDADISTLFKVLTLMNDGEHFEYNEIMTLLSDNRDIMYRADDEVEN